MAATLTIRRHSAPSSRVVSANTNTTHQRKKKPQVVCANCGGLRGPRTIYLDNLRLRRADGSTVRQWLSGKDTRSQKDR